MKTILKKFDIESIVTVIPTKIIKFEDEIENYNFSEKSSLKLKKMMGLSERRIVDDDVTSGDLCYFGIEYLIDNNYIDKKSIDAIVFISQTPDYFIPPTSNLIQGRLGLNDDVICIDINHGCAGFLFGLFQANSMLNENNINTVLLLNGDTASKQVSYKDRNSNPLVGDAGSVTVLRKSKNHVPFFLKIDGSRWKALYIPAGGYKLRSNKETKILKDIGNGNFRSKEHIHMEGTSIFNFTMNEIPIMINDILNYSKTAKEDIDYFLLHQPNQFILKKLQKVFKVEQDKLFDNIVGIYGNNSSVTIPTNICHNLSNQFLKKKSKCCLAAFGVGLTWSAAIMDIGDLKYCGIIEYEK